ncbi:DUF3429 domain-containing protein [Wenzhouxiangella marina]|uniref:Uncharacterized protein n=1 Tax=Wenzhouxiangella marina TaxID=1579979 RepID=A0A0K0XTK8_9GAMM|nr:DUF3429 domain-containing protein [Wenzhouxiangella marina]AKS40957.1 hypothetical protein WM2015_575 [Wenzhouxiangella marina]MBB6087831.1 hypothetical protein [Wenzhouxiangella marina]
MTRTSLESDRWITTTRGLGWAGVIPFAGLALTRLTGAPDWLDRLLIGYGLLILAFLCGTLWQRELQSAAPRSSRLIASNLILLGAWPAMLLPQAWAAMLLAAGFAAHLAVDPPWKLRALPGWYRRLRLGLSSTVIALLVLTWLIATGRAL